MKRPMAKAVQAPRIPTNRTSPTGFLRFDRRFAQLGVRRLQHSSGTNDPQEFVRRDGILSRLAAHGNRETLQAFVSGEINIEHLVEFEAQDNLKYGLRDFRLANCSESGLGITVPTPRSQDTGASVRADSHGSVSTSGSDTDLVALPIWETFLSAVIPSLRRVKTQTKRRYATSIRSFAQKLGAFSLAEDDFAVLVDVRPDLWEWLARARMRAMRVQTVRDVVSLGAKGRRTFLRDHNIRIDVLAFDALRDLTVREWTALLAAAEFPVAEEMIIALDRAGRGARARLRTIAQTLGSGASISALGVLSEDDWELVCEFWGASAADWNHLRRALSKCLTSHLGSSRHPLREQVIARIRMRPEIERVPNISAAKIKEICGFLPEPIKDFPWVLVLSGLRISEYLRLTQAHLVPSAFAIQVPGTKTAGSTREVYIAPEAWSMVVDAVPCHYRSYQPLRRQWITACEAAGVHGVTLHDLRHCSGQIGADVGVDHLTLQAHFGHKSPDMTARYMRRTQQARGARAISGVVMAHARSAAEEASKAADPLRVETDVA